MDLKIYEISIAQPISFLIICDFKLIRYLVSLVFIVVKLKCF
jgi:hypothetical protein